MFSVFRFCSLFLLSVFSFPFSVFSSPPVIRLALLKDISKITITGPELRIQIEEIKPVSYFLDSPTIVSASSQGLKINEDLEKAPTIKIFSLENKITLDGRPVEGILEIRQTPEQKLFIVNELPLETYLVGLIHGEINASWPKEAIKAQAVAARTYALHRQQKRKTQKAFYDLEIGVSDQVYAGPQGEKDLLAQKAIEETQGEVLWFLGYYPAYFHSCCGGQTEVASHVWKNSDDSRSVIDPFCKGAPFHSWELSLSPKQLLGALKEHGLEGSYVKSITLERFENSPRNALVLIETNKMTLFLGANDLRRMLGFQNLKSTWFEVSHSQRQITFKGTGYGHGVGLCQWGAKAMAEAGKTHREILQFYYPKAVLRKIY